MKYLSNINDSEKRLHALYASQARESIVEIGVLSGATTRLLLERSTCTVFGIDPIVPDSMDENLIGDINRIAELEKNYIRFIFIKDYSHNVVKTWTHGIDYIFIDGDHNYKAVKRDFEDWFPHVNQGGVISFHDSACNRGGPKYWPGPSKFVDGILEDRRLEYITTVQTMTVFRKR